MKKEEDLNIY